MKKFFVGSVIVLALLFVVTPAHAQQQVLGHITYSPCDENGWQYVYEDVMNYPAGGIPYRDTILIGVMPCGYLTRMTPPLVPPVPVPDSHCRITDRTCGSVRKEG